MASHQKEPMEYPSEYQEQGCVVDYLKRVHPNLPWFAVPNGGKRKPKEGAQLRHMGLRAGVPDLFFLVPKCGYNGLAIEMKKRGKYSTSDKQEDFIEMLTAQNFKAVVCVGADAAIQTIIHYMMGVK